MADRIKLVVITGSDLNASLRVNGHSQGGGVEGKLYVAAPEDAASSVALGDLIKSKANVDSGSVSYWNDNNFRVISANDIDAVRTAFQFVEVTTLSALKTQVGMLAMERQGVRQKDGGRTY
jgi:hypothetical protein